MSNIVGWLKDVCREVDYQVDQLLHRPFCLLLVALSILLVPILLVYKVVPMGLEAMNKKLSGGVIQIHREPISYEQYLASLEHLANKPLLDDDMLLENKRGEARRTDAGLDMSTWQAIIRRELPTTESSGDSASLNWRYDRYLRNCPK
jgi:hypothetical protein